MRLWLVYISGDSKWRHFRQNICQIWQFLQWSGHIKNINDDQLKVNHSKDYGKRIQSHQVITVRIMAWRYHHTRCIATEASIWLETQGWNAKMEFGPDPPLYALSQVIAFINVITNVIIIIIDIVIIRTHHQCHHHPCMHCSWWLSLSMSLLSSQFSPLSTPMSSSLSSTSTFFGPIIKVTITPVCTDCDNHQLHHHNFHLVNHIIFTFIRSLSFYWDPDKWTGDSCSGIKDVSF